jgi:putative membrane protein
VPWLPDWSTARIGRSGRLGLAFDRLTRLPMAFVLFNAAIRIWHVPALYDAVFRDEDLHIVEHLLFIGTAVIAWRPALQKWPTGTGMHAKLGKMAYLIWSMPSCTRPTALITFSPRPPHLFCMQSPRHWQLAVSPMLDQQVGGVLMGRPAERILMLAALIFGNRWLLQMAGQTGYRTRLHAA